MAATKKKTTKSGEKTKGSELKVSSPKKTTRRKKTTDEAMSDVGFSESAPKSKIFTKKYLYAVLIVLAVIGVLFTLSRLWIVAWVDNKPITRFEIYSLLEKRDDGKTAEELIVERLLVSEGQKQKQSVSDAEVETEIKKIEEQQGGAEQLNQILEIQKLSQVDFRKLVELQLLKQKLFGTGTAVTDEDVNKYIEENKASLPPGIMDNPESSEAAQLRESAKEQLKQVKVNENFNTWLGEALNSSRVVRGYSTPAPAPLAPPANP